MFSLIQTIPAKQLSPAQLLRLGFSILFLLTACSAAWAESDSSGDAVRDVLAAQDGDEDKRAVLQETLTAADKRYSMLPARKFAVTYDLSYSYIGEQLIDADFTADQLTSFRIENTRGHTLTNLVSTDYGILNNLTGNLSVPLVSKYSDTDEFDGDANAFGDISAGVRFQPFTVQRDWPSLTVSATARLPTGRGPFDTSPRELATGSGHSAFTLGINSSKVIDPVAIFGSINFTHNLPQDDLDIMQGENILTEVAAGSGIGWGAGFAYAMSYNITTTMSFQQYFQGASEFLYITPDGAKQTSKSSNQTSAILNIGLGVRVASMTTLNFTLGIGMTPDSPDFSLGLNVPLRF